MKTVLFAATLALLAFAGPVLAADGADTVPPPIPPLNAQLTTPLQSALDGNRTALAVLAGLAVLMIAAMLFWAAHLRRRGKHRTTTDYPGPSLRDRDNAPKNTGPINTPVP